MTDLQCTKAKIWARDHDTHVLKMVFQDDEGGYAPNKEDNGAPELWKPEHWQWFFINKL